MTRLALALLIVVLTASTAVGQAPWCQEAAVLKNTINRQGEYLRFAGISEDGQYLTQIFVDDREGSQGGFTIIISRADDTKACVLFSGFGFDKITSKRKRGEAS